MVKRIMMVVAILSAVGFSAVATAAEVWSGLEYTFTKADYADWNLPANQDRLTDNVWITRKNSQGIFNIAQETGYGAVSPADTEWAYGTTAEWETLTFDTWVNWHGGNPASSIDQEAVLHLIADDIYIDVMFLSFTGGNAGGGFSYIRAAEPAAPIVTPSLSSVGIAVLLLSFGGLLARIRNRRR